MEPANTRTCAPPHMLYILYTQTHLDDRSRAEVLATKTQRGFHLVFSIEAAVLVVAFHVFCLSPASFQISLSPKWSVKKKGKAKGLQNARFNRPCSCWDYLGGHRESGPHHE